MIKAAPEVAVTSAGAFGHQTIESGLLSAWRPVDLVHNWMARQPIDERLQKLPMPDSPQANLSGN